VKRVREVAARYGVAPAPLEALLRGLEAEADPPTTVADPVFDHVADSLAVLPELGVAPNSVADVGSGVGFPGLALAAAFPGAAVVLVESQRRHAAVAERLGRGAGLGNVSVAAARVESLGAPESFDLVSARAVASLSVLVEYAAPLLRLGGVFVAWKGARDVAEEEAGEGAARVVGLGPARVVRAEPFPGAHSRHLHLFEKVAPTPPRFPRRPGMARKRPLRT
jgi:16S rRNA (guanine527-N7)-methyltransferase